MIVEGLVFRVVTASHPGDPSLEEFGCPRTEYLADSSSETLRWTCKREEAERFPSHGAAEKLAKEFGFHAGVVGASEDAIPERCRPIVPDPAPPTPTIRARKKRKSRLTMPALPAGRDWVKETYG